MSWKKAGNLLVLAKRYDSPSSIISKSAGTSGKSSRMPPQCLSYLVTIPAISRLLDSLTAPPINTLTSIYLPHNLTTLISRNNYINYTRDKPEVKEASSKTFVDASGRIAQRSENPIKIPIHAHMVLMTRCIARYPSKTAFSALLFGRARLDDGVHRARTRICVPPEGAHTRSLSFSHRQRSPPLFHRISRVVALPRLFGAAMFDSPRDRSPRCVFQRTCTADKILGGLSASSTLICIRPPRNRTDRASRPMHPLVCGFLPSSPPPLLLAQRPSSISRCIVDAASAPAVRRR